MDPWPLDESPSREKMANQGYIYMAPVFLGKINWLWHKECIGGYVFSKCVEFYLFIILLNKVPILLIGQKNSVKIYSKKIIMLLCFNLSMKEGCLFVLFVLTRSTPLGCFRSCSCCLWKALDEEECMGLVSWHLDLLCKSS